MPKKSTQCEARRADNKKPNSTKSVARSATAFWGGNMLGPLGQKDDNFGEQRGGGKRKN